MLKFQGKSLILSLLLTGIVSLFAVGCGSSQNNDFVFTGNNQNPANTGSLVFRFAQPVAQTVNNVPAATRFLRFDFFTTNPPAQGGLIFTETREFSPLITFNNVSTSVKSVVVTAFDINNQPLVTFSTAVIVVGGSSVDVDLDDSQPVTLTEITASPDPIRLAQGDSQQVAVNGTFSNGSAANLTSVATYEFVEANGAVLNPPTTTTAAASVTAGGLVTFVEPGQNAVLRVSRTFNGVTRTDEIDVLSFEFQAVATNPLTVGPAQPYLGGYTLTLTDSDGSLDDINDEDSGVTYSLASGTNSDVTVNSTTGVVTLAQGSTFSGTATVIVRYTAPPGSNAAGLVFEDEVVFNVSNG